MKFVTTLCASLLFATVASTAHASPAGDYLDRLNGKWRGGGTISSAGNGKETRVRCSMRNAKKSDKLAIAGRCASSAGTRPIRGSLAAQGKKISSDTVRLPGVGRMRNVTTKLANGTLILTGNVKQKGKAVPVRTRITPGGSMLKMRVQSQANGKWSDRGTLTFRR